MTWDWECYVCGGHAVNRLKVGYEFAWSWVWFCDEHVVGGCERMT